MSRPRSLTLWITCALASATLSFSHHARAKPDVRYVHATVLNLRKLPKPTAPVATMVPIGSACSVNTDVGGGWLELQCEVGSGFAKADLLGTTPPSPSTYLLQATGKSPLPTRLLAAQRALALLPSDAEAQKIMREVFWQIQWARLDEARAATPAAAGRVIALPACNNAESCIDKALLEGASVSWSALHKRSNDFLHAMLYPDGALRIRAGVLSGDRASVETDQTTVPAVVVARALGAKDAVDICSVAPKTGSEILDPLMPGLLCGFEFDQNCDPSTCASDHGTCTSEVRTTCDACAATCSSSCENCRSACDGKSAAERATCVAACKKTMTSCAPTCRATADRHNARCDQTYDSCSSTLVKECKPLCDALYKCTDGGAEQDACAKKLDASQTCADYCFSG